MIINNTEMSETEVRAYIEMLQRENYVMQQYILAKYFSDIDDSEESVHDYD